MTITAETVRYIKLGRGWPMGGCCDRGGGATFRLRTQPEISLAGDADAIKQHLRELGRVRGGLPRR